MVIAEFKYRRDVFFLFRPFIRKGTATHFKAKMVMDNGLMLEVGKVVKFDTGLKMLVLKSKKGVNYLKTIRKEGQIVVPSTFKVLPWKYIPQNT